MEACLMYTIKEQEQMSKRLRVITSTEVVNPKLTLHVSLLTCELKLLEVSGSKSEIKQHYGKYML